MKKTTMIVVSIAVVAVIIVSTLAIVFLTPQKQHLRMATTTSTQDSGLLDYILPIYENRSNCIVEVIAVGSGQAM